ncbi:zinc finger protein, putative [Plasmodium malariae]|uniref:Zinc finger protein, putative n=1 Tax=Plasmodium malariae TaxID=5858 RepID=A0A1D3SQ92_PLAMA|nr:zinc finger protein, putative [Plasmodium malariae]SCO94069.1 zinc finger protein, putative [Plasmodium malariae]
MYRSRDNLVKNNKKHEFVKSQDEKNSQGENTKYINISYHIRKLFSYCDADILRIENNLIIYNSLIDNIKKNGNKIIKKEVEKIIREKEKNEKYCLKEMKEEVFRVNNFDLKKVELDFKFIECSLCFELIKFVCIQECNHTYCFLCFYRLLYMEKKENDTENNNRRNSNIRENNSSNNNMYRNYTINRNPLRGIDNFEYFNNNNSRSNERRKEAKDEKYNYDFDKEKMKCPFCKERNEYIFFCLNNFYTYFTYDNLLQTLLEKEKDKYDFSKETIQLTDLNGHLFNRKNQNKGSEINRSLRENREGGTLEEYHIYTHSSIDENEKDLIRTDNNIDEKKDNFLKGQNELTTKNDIKKAFSSYYDDIIILRNILKMNSEANSHNNNNSNSNTSNNATKKCENLYLFFYYEKYIKRKKEKVQFLLNACVSSLKRYAFYSKIFVDTEKKIFYEYFYIFSLSTLLTSYVCLLAPCIEYWVMIQSKKVEKFKLNHKTDKYFEKIYIDSEKDIIRKKNDSIYDKYQQPSKNFVCIKEEESELSDDYFKVIDIFSKACFTNLDNVNNLSNLKNYCYKTLSGLCKHIGEHNKTYCDICVGNNDNIFLFEYNIFYKKYVKVHIEYGEKISENKYKTRHIYCHLCGFYLYDFDTFMNHINKYHFFCKFCFNKNPSDGKDVAKNGIEDVVYYDLLHLHVYKDYENLFDHYKKKHHPCLYEQCIFVVFDNKIDLCFHIAEKHEEKGSNKKNKITFSIGGASYNEIRNNGINGNGNNNSGISGTSSYYNNNKRDRNSKDISNSLEHDDQLGNSKKTFDVNSHRCLYNFKRFYDSWYFDYYVECNIVNFVQYFSTRKYFFLYIMRTDMDIILKVFENLWKNNSDLYFSQDEIIELNRSIIEEDFPMSKNNFFLFKLFLDYIIEKIDFLLYNKEDLERNYLSLFFHIIVHKSFVLYYAFFFLYLNERCVNLDKVITTVYSSGSTTNNKADSSINNHTCSNNIRGNNLKKNTENMQKTKHIYNYEKDMIRLRKIIEQNAKISLAELSKYGFLYLIFLFFKIDKNGFERVYTFVKNISLLCKDTYDKIKKVDAKGDINKNCSSNRNSNSNHSNNNNILIPLVQKKKEKSKHENEMGNGSSLLDAINSQKDFSELEDVNQLIKKYSKRKGAQSSNIINNIYDKKWDISKKVVLDLLYYIDPNLNLVSFFYLFLSNYFCAYMKDSCINNMVNISNENKKNILKRISYDVDLASLTSISKDLSNFVNAKTLEECLSTGPEYYRIRKDIEIILKTNGQNGKNGRTNNESDRMKYMDSTKINVNLYDVSLSLRNRFLNIIKSTKVNELYVIYFYVSSIMLSSTSCSSSKNEEFPSLFDMNNNMNTTSNGISINNVVGVYSKETLNILNRNASTSINNRVNSPNKIKNKNASSYKNKVEQSKEEFLNTRGQNIDLEYPPLPEMKQEDTVQLLLKQDKSSKKNEKNSSKNAKNSNKIKGNKDHRSDVVSQNVTLNKNKKENKFSPNKTVVNNMKINKENENNAKKITCTKSTTPDFMYSDFPSLCSNIKADENKTKKNKNNEKGKDCRNKNIANVRIESFTAEEFPSLHPIEENKKKINRSSGNSSKNNRNKKNNNNNNNNCTNINHVNRNSEKDKHNKCTENTNDTPFAFNQKSYLNASEGNVTFTIKKKSKVKRCNMCTYENLFERTKCELCESPL